MYMYMYPNSLCVHTSLYRYGNTSSSSIWYEMDYIRNFTNLTRGNRVLQVKKVTIALYFCPLI